MSLVPVRREGESMKLIPLKRIRDEALAVTVQTGLTPAQLQARVAELEALVALVKKDIAELWDAGEISCGWGCLTALGVTSA